MERLSLVPGDIGLLTDACVMLDLRAVGHYS